MMADILHYSHLNEDLPNGCYSISVEYLHSQTLTKLGTTRTAGDIWITRVPNIRHHHHRHPTKCHVNSGEVLLNVSGQCRTKKVSSAKCV